MIASAVAALVVTGVAMPVVLAWLRRVQLLDHPNARSSHRLPTPRGAGVAVMLGITSGILAGHASGARGVAWLLLPVTACAMVGLVDDFRGLRASLRLAVQALAAAAFVFVLLYRLGAPDGVESWWSRAAACATAVVWIVGCTNAFNFMDGVNGISALNAILAGGFFAWLGATREVGGLELTGAVVAICALAFLPWNIPRARVFLGDVGSYTFGCVLAVAAVSAAWQGVDVILAVAPLCIYLADTGWALLKRLHGGQPLGVAHRQHVYQRLVDGGVSHVASAAITMTASAMLVVVATVIDESGAMGPALLAAAIVVGYLNLPRMIGARRGRRQSAEVTA